LKNNNITVGHMFVGIGVIDTVHTNFKINKDTHPEDYKIVDDWIKNIE
jgi:hypothetical protein